MATIQVSVETATKGNFPGFCMRCGAPSAKVVDREITISAGGFSTASLFSGSSPVVPAQYLTIRVPTCALHEKHWATDAVILFVGKIVVLVALAAFMFLIAYSGISTFLLMFALAAFVGGYFVLYQTPWIDEAFGPISVKAISGASLTIVGVAPAFAAKLPATPTSSTPAAAPVAADVPATPSANPPSSSSGAPGVS